MGIIRRQSIQASVLYYIGAAIGFLSKILIFPNFLSTEEVGLSNILVTNALLYAQFAAIGFSTMTLRFFPFFNDKSRRHHDFLALLIVIPGIAFLVVTMLVVLFREPLLGYFSEKSPLMVDYFWYLIPLAFASLYFELLDAYLRSLLKTVVPILFREVIQRVLVIVSILIYAFGWIDFPQFVFVYVALLSSVTLMMVVYIRWLGHFHFRMRRSWRMKLLMRRLVEYGAFTLLGNVSAITLYTIDGLMLAAYVGMEAVGVYTTSFYVTALILIPWRAIQKVSSPQVAENWVKGDMVAMGKLYQRTSLLNVGIGCYLFFAMVIGMDALFSLMPKDFQAGKAVIIVVGASRLVDMVAGLNGFIMLTSKYFRMDLLFNMLLVVMAIALNAWLIPLHGILGAAIATGAALVLSNIFRVIFLWQKLGLHPVTKELLWMMLIAAAAFMAQWALPVIDNVWWSFGLRVTVFSLVFVVPLLYFRLIPDVNRLFEMLQKKIFG